MRRRRTCGRPTIARAGLAGLVTGAPAPVAAELVAFAVEGVLFAITDHHRLLDGSVALGGPMRPSVVYDGGTVDRMPSDPSWGYYPQPIPPASLQIEVGSHLFEASVLEVSTIDDGIFGNDGLFFRKEPRGDFPGFPRVAGAVVESLLVDLDDWTTTALSSDALPTRPPTSPPWSRGQVSVTSCLATEAGPLFCEYPPSIVQRACLRSWARRRRAHRPRVASAAPARPSGSGTSSTAPTSQRAVPSPSPSRGRRLPR